MTSLVCDLVEHGANTPHKFFDNYVLSPYKWESKKVWVHLEDTEERKKQDMTLNEIELLIKNVETTWEAYLGVTFAHTRYLDKSDITIKFSDVPPPAVGLPSWTSQTLAVGHYPYSTTNRVSGDIWINSKDHLYSDFAKSIKLQNNFSGKKDFKSMLGHEFGHAIGLGHSQDMKALMAPYYMLRYPYVLTNDDILGGQAIYNMNKQWSDGLRKRLGF